MLCLARGATWRVCLSHSCGNHSRRSLQSASSRSAPTFVQRLMVSYGSIRQVTHVCDQIQFLAFTHAQGPHMTNGNEVKRVSRIGEDRNHALSHTCRSWACLAGGGRGSWVSIVTPQEGKKADPLITQTLESDGLDVS